MPFVSPQFIIMTATRVFVFCFVVVVEMPLLDKIDEYSAKIYNFIIMSYEEESQTCPDNVTWVDFTYIDTVL